MFSYWTEIKNSVLEAGFRDVGEGIDKEIYVHIPSPYGAPASEHVYQKASFFPASSSSIKLESVMFMIGGPSSIDKITLAADPAARDVLSVITLEGDEIKDYSSSGTFAITDLVVDII